MNDVTNLYMQRQAVLVTMHGKESVIVPVLSTHLGMHVTTLTHIDTDQFGTFTGDIARRDSQYQTAIAKAMAGIESSGCDVGIASEGSFGPHPDVPWITINRELVVLVDCRHDWVIEGWATSVETSAVRREVTTRAAAHAFCDAVGFPAQGVIMRVDSDPPVLFKECTTHEAFDAQVAQLLQTYQTIWLETDLRAHRNPKRRVVIQQAVAQLVANAQRICPACAAPGMHVVETVYGLPCEWCGTPTNLRKAEVFGCVRCTYRYAQDCGDALASPEYCEMCNP
jgi:hypothetical protein